jgi:chloramphenicol O-acetyltransferase
MKTLKSLLPDDFRPIIVSDAGFKVPWFKLVLFLGWDYLGRSRKPNYFSLNGENWQSITVLFKQATSTAKCFKGLLTKYKQYPTTFVLYKNRAKNRHKLTKNGKRAQSKKSNHHAVSGGEPWLLVTSLAVTSKLAKRIVKIYKKDGN